MGEKMLVHYLEREVRENTQKECYDPLGLIVLRD
jgi:hypothetical protein